MIGAILGLVFIVSLSIGIPIAFGLGLTSLLYFVLNDMSPIIIAHRMIGGMFSFTLLAIPLFILAGKLMNIGGITTRIFRMSTKLVGHIPGSLAHVNVIASVIFAGMTGSALSDMAGLGTIELKAMKEEGFDPAFSAAVTGASSIVGPIIPPSVPLVVYGVLSETSIGRLFLAGILPGLLVSFCLMVLIFLKSKKMDLPKHQRAKFKEIIRSVYESLPALFLPLFILGSIVGGITSPTEAGVVAVLYSGFLGVFVYKELTFRDFINACIETAEATAIIMIVIGLSSVFGWILTIEQVPILIGNFLLNITENPIIFLMIVNLFLLLLGSFMETTAIMMIVVPLLAPALVQFGIDPVHFGIILVLNLMIGLLTPPFGMGLFVLSDVAEVSVEKITRALVPFFIPLVCALILISIFPFLSTIVPNLIMGI